MLLRFQVAAGLWIDNDQAIAVPAFLAMTRLSQLLVVLTQQLLKCTKQGGLTGNKSGEGDKKCLSCVQFGYWYVLKTRFGVRLSCCMLHAVCLICWRKLVKMLLLLLLPCRSAFTVTRRPDCQPVRLFPGKLPSPVYADFNPFRLHATCERASSLPLLPSAASKNLFSWPNCEGPTVCISRKFRFGQHIKSSLKMFALYDLA